MKRLVKYLSIASLLAFCALLVLGKVGTVYQGAQGAIGLVTEQMMLLAAGNSTWNFSQDVHGFVKNPGASDYKLDRYVSGQNTFGTFDDLYRDPAGGPYSTPGKNSLLVHGSGARWGVLTGPTGGGVAGYVLQVGDDPSIFGVGTDDLFFGPTPATAAGWTSLAGYFTSHAAHRLLTTSATSGNLLEDSGIEAFGGSLNLSHVGTDTLSVNSITLAGVNLSPSSAGEYTPTLTIVGNVVDATAGRAFWSRVGDIVTVRGLVSVTCNATGANAVVDLSLPAGNPSNFSAVDDLVGSGEWNSVQSAKVYVHANTLNDRTRIEAAGFVGVHEYVYNYSYIVQ